MASGGVVDDQVAAGGGLQGADVAPFPADDPALHLVGGQRHHADRGLAGGVGRAAGDGLADHFPGDVVAFVLHVGLVGGDAHGLFVGELIVDLLEQHGAGVLLGHGGDGFQLFHLAQLELFQFVQPGFHQFGALFQVFFLALHGGGALVQRLLLLVHAAFLAADLGAAVLDLLVRLALQLEGFVLGFDDGFLPFLFGGFDRIVDDPLGLLLSGAEFGLGHALAVGDAEVKAERPDRGGNDDDHQHRDDGGHVCQLLKMV